MPESTATPVQSTPVTNQEANNEALLGKPKESVATAPVQEVPPEQTPIAKKKIKWGEQEREVSFDEAVQLAQKAWGIEEKAKTVAQKANQVENILHMLQTDYKGFVKQCVAAGIPKENIQKLATEILYENIRLNSLSPEQRELEELKAKQAEEETHRKELEEAAKKAEIDAKTQEWGKKFEADLTKALAEKKLPMSRLTLALAAQYIDAGLQEKKEFTVEQVLPFVMRDLKNIHMSTLGQLDGDALLDYIGEEVSNKIAAARVARYKKGSVTPVSQPKKEENKGSLSKDITKLKGKAYWAALRKMKTEQGVGAFPGQE